MKTVNITEFKTHCLRLVEEMGRTRESIEILKRGKPVGVLNPPAAKEIDWTPGAFRDMVEVGDICVDGADLGVRWEAME